MFITFYFITNKIKIILSYNSIPKNENKKKERKSKHK